MCVLTSPHLPHAGSGVVQYSQLDVIEGVGGHVIREGWRRRGFASNVVFVAQAAVVKVTVDKLGNEKPFFFLPLEKARWQVALVERRKPLGFTA